MHAYEKKLCVSRRAHTVAMHARFEEYDCGVCREYGKPRRCESTIKNGTTICLQPWRCKRTHDDTAMQKRIRMLRRQHAEATPFIQTWQADHSLAELFFFREDGL